MILSGSSSSNLETNLGQSATVYWQPWVIGHRWAPVTVITVMVIRPYGISPTATALEGAIEDILSAQDETILANS
jgi:hypothetical protein